MKNKLKWIELVLENCESIYIDPKYARVHIIEEEKHYMLNTFARRCLSVENTCELSMFIGSPSEALEFMTFGKKSFNKAKIQKRLELHKDVCKIHFEFNNKKLNKHWSIKWSDEADEYHDPRMIIEVQDGELHIESAGYKKAV